jgi:hypothetical protein
MTSHMEQAINRLLFALSQHPEGMTTQQLVEFSGGSLSKKQVPQLLRYSSHVQEGYSEEGGSMNMTAILWKLKKYSPSSAKGQDLKERIQAGSLG